MPSATIITSKVPAAIKQSISAQTQATISTHFQIPSQSSHSMLSPTQFTPPN
jgi:hypothetical protein